MKNETHIKRPSDLIAVIIDADGVRLFAEMTDADGSTLLNCAMEDPECWSDIEIVWPRYRVSAEATDAAGALEMKTLELPDAIDLLGRCDEWFALDLVQKRLLLGGEPTESFSTGGLFPQWWEFHDGVKPWAIASVRHVPAAVPNPRRDVLWGKLPMQCFARNMVERLRSGEPWKCQNRQGDVTVRYDSIVAVHRDWLMTPLPQLCGGRPRDCLHGGIDWLGGLIEFQMARMSRGVKVPALSAKFSNFDRAPMGLHEVVMYFNACRETIEVGWQWMLRNEHLLADELLLPELVSEMDKFLTQWLKRSHLNGESPRLVIETERGRIPLVVNRDAVDSDSPSCATTKNGGPTFVHYDGHLLEMDDEFAFSLCETRDEWEFSHPTDDDDNDDDDL